jgi:hypothetical protein
MFRLPDPVRIKKQPSIRSGVYQVQRGRRQSKGRPQTCDHRRALRVDSATTLRPAGVEFDMKPSEAVTKQKKTLPAGKAIAGAAPAPEPPPTTVRQRINHFLILTAGVVATHFVLFAPSLLGFKVLLPLNFLATSLVYLPRTPEYADVPPGNPALSDQVFQFEFQRRFAAEEFRAGRIPLWDPYHYCGAPFVVPFWTPFNIPYYLVPHYVTLAWTHVLVALVAAGGAYVFFRQALGVGFWPAVVTAWCFPLTGFFVLWLGFYLTYTAAFLPWLFVAVESTVRRPRGLGGPALAVFTGLILISGAFDLAGQALLACGLYAVWRLGGAYLRDKKPVALVAPAAALTGAWVLGFLLAAPYWAPLTDYAKTGVRFESRGAQSHEERPPIGPSALAQFFVPYVYGETWPGWAWLSRAPNLQESAAQGYAGLFAALVLAPVGLSVRRLRSLNIFWLLLMVFASAWVLNLPGLVALLRLPGMNLMSHNRFLFVASFAILALAAAGLDAVARGEVVWRKAFFVPVGLLVAIGIAVGLEAALIDAAVSPDAPRSQDGIVKPPDPKQVSSPENVKGVAIARGYLRNYAIGAALMCVVGVFLWLLIARAPGRTAARVLSVALLADLLWIGWDQNPQTDPSLYYPPVASLVKLQERIKKEPGRVTGLQCIVPMMAQRFGLHDVRGYDAVDPKRIVNLLLELRDPRSGVFDYTKLQWWLPFLSSADPANPKKFKLLPALSMLNLRYIIGRPVEKNQQPPDPFAPVVIEGDDYWVYENPYVMPRVFVPDSVAVGLESNIIAALTQEPVRRNFDPRAVAYVSSGSGFEPGCKGRASIDGETPCEVRVKVNMETPGLLVLADQWYEGWNAYLDGKPLPILRANYAFRGVNLPKGEGQVVFRYEPASWSRGLRMFGFAFPAILMWSAASVWFGRRKAAPAPAA